MIEKLKSLSRLSLATKSALFSVIGIVLVSASIIIAVLVLVEREMRSQAQARQESNMRVAWDVLRSFGNHFRVAGDRLMVGDHAINGDTAAVDRIQKLVGGTATVFLGDTRISTNVRKADGSRAIGTKLAQGPAYDAVLKRGEPYRGEADILGERYFTGYDPITFSASRSFSSTVCGFSSHTVSVAVT